MPAEPLRQNRSSETMERKLLPPATEGSRPPFLEPRSYVPGIGSVVADGEERDDGPSLVEIEILGVLREHLGQVSAGFRVEFHMHDGSPDGGPNSPTAVSLR